MPKKNKKKEKEKEPNPRLHPETKKSIGIVVFLGFAIIFILAAAGQAGPVGGAIYNFLNRLFGWGYYLLPVVFFLMAFAFTAPEQKKLLSTAVLGGFVFIFSGLGFIDIVSPGDGGLIGAIIGSLKRPFGQPVALITTLTILIASFLAIVNRPLRVPKFKESTEPEISGMEIAEPTVADTAPQIETPARSCLAEAGGKEEKEEKKSEEKLIVTESAKAAIGDRMAAVKTSKSYVFPPLTLLNANVEKPTIGDLRANANIIKRTLESFGLSVEMGEVNVGPTITRYTLKPAEGIKLSRIIALNQDLALALAAHPIRIEAPIPGKSLVGIEVPNKTGALVRLGSLLRYPEFQKINALTFALGRNVNGEPVFADIDKMPHLLFAGATGSGKSIAIHSLIISLLYKNTPEMLKLILIDPKRVELSAYDGLPHLVTPVITDTKKSMGVFRWLIQEMEDRYQTLLEAGARDIKTYNQRSTMPLSYILIIIDELADLMTSYGREVEGAIIRLAQMSRATGIHLIVSTQRPSVEIITGLIKANITSRIALQVASQVDSRTILDTGGAEKLLGSGDLLFVSAEFSKPRRLQGAYITEEEIKKVVNFIRENNKIVSEEEINFESAKEIEAANDIAAGGDDDDELYEEAIAVVRVAKKASASLLQRRLKVGYARAARLLDIMEERGVIGPGEGAKPREVYPV